MRKYVCFWEDPIKNFLSGLNCFRGPWGMIGFVFRGLLSFKRILLKGKMCRKNKVILPVAYWQSIKFSFLIVCCTGFFLVKKHIA